MQLHRHVPSTPTRVRPCPVPPDGFAAPCGMSDLGLLRPRAHLNVKLKEFEASEDQVGGCRQLRAVGCWAGPGWGRCALGRW